MMNPKYSAWLAWALCAMVIAGSALFFVLTWNNPTMRADVFTFLNGLTSALFPIAYGVVGALILSRRARNRIGWLLMVIAFSIAVVGSLQSYVEQSLTGTAGLTASEILVIWLSGWGWWLLIGPLLLILLTFPTGHLLSPRWRWVVGLIALQIATFTLIVTLSPQWQDTTTGAKFPNPLGIHLLPADFTFETIQVPWIMALLTTVGLCVLAVFIRYRRSGIVEREQLKWFLFACALFVAFYLSFGVLFIDTNPPTWTGILFNAILMFLPVSIGIAILRYRLFDIDVIIRRTVTYALVVALLLVVYFGSVIVLQQVFAGITGQRSEVITVLSTLAIAALFVPVRYRVQNAIDKRFDRKKYNAQQVLQKFAQTVRDETDLDKLTGELVNVVQETMQPKSVSLWLKRENGGRRTGVG